LQKYSENSNLTFINIVLLVSAVAISNPTNLSGLVGSGAVNTQVVSVNTLDNTSVNVLNGITYNVLRYKMFLNQFFLYIIIIYILCLSYY
jgi:hypothetical protein